MKFLFELSGEHPSMPKAELIAAAKSETRYFKIVSQGQRTIIFDINPRAVERIAKRIALTHTVNKVLTESGDFKGLLKNVSRIKVPKGTFAVRSESYSSYDLTNLYMEKTIGSAIPGKNKVDLTRPQHEYRIVKDKKYYLCLKICSIDKKDFESRTPQKRLFFSPITLHPRLARALVNLSQVKKGDMFLDPFCGTGGIMIEAGLVGSVISGNDIQQKMVTGSTMNLKQYGLKGTFFCADISELPGSLPKGRRKFDAIATDPPYGRAASTRNENIKILYRRSFKTLSTLLKKGKFLSIVLPSSEMTGLCGNRFRLIECHAMRVHRSLTRYFCVYQLL